MECLARYPIDPKKFAVLGFSQGGVMAYSPGAFGSRADLPRWRRSALGYRKNWCLKIEHQRVQSLPMLVQHGTQDPTIPVERARDSVEQLRQWRLPLTYREYDMGHEISPTSLNDLSAWLEEKVGAIGR